MPILRTTLLKHMTFAVNKNIKYNSNGTVIVIILVEVTPSTFRR